jgi:uncharacterized protein with GYD domain
MQTYIMLAKLTEKGREDIKGIAERRQKNIDDLQQNGIRIVADYAVMGDYDFVYVVEVADQETLMRQLIKDTGGGRLAFHTMPAIPLDQFEGMTKDLQPKS